MIKRVLSMCLACMLLFTCLPYSGMAAEQPAEETFVTQPTEELQVQEQQVQTPATGAVIASGGCGAGVTWKLDDAGTLTIAGSGGINDYSKENRPWNALVESVKVIRVESGVTKIGKNAFYRMDKVERVYLPNTLARIGEDAFYGCVAMKELELPEGLTQIDDYAFIGCAALTQLTIPASLTYIGYSAFRDCSGLKALTIPKTLQTVEGGAFENCTGLTQLTFEEGVTDPGDYPGCTGLTEVTIPSSVKRIPSSMFSHCTGLQKVTLQEGITEVAGYAFNGCIALTEINLPSTVTAIGQQAFENCFSLTGFTVPVGVETIPYRCFKNCMGLLSVVISGKVTRVREGAFSGCGRLTDVYYTDTQEQWKKVILETDNSNLTRANIHCAEIHAHILTAYAAKAPTCTSYGWEAYEKCALCDYTTYVQIPAIDHSYESTVVAPTCLEQGYTQHRCVCGDIRKDNFVAALGHDYSTEVIAPTYGNLGYTRYTCSRCDDRYDTDYVDRLDIPAPQAEIAVDPVSGKIVLRWDSLGDGIHFEVYRATKKTGKYTLVGKQITDSFWEDPKATVGTTYYYKVRAVCTEEKAWYSAYSGILSAVPICAVPALTVDVNRSTGKPLLKWNKVSGAKKYEVYRIDEAGSVKKLTTTTKTTYTDTKATTGKSYAYYLRALGSKSAYHSGYCEPLVTLCFMGAPTLTLTKDAATGKPSLSWTSVKGAQVYIVCRILPEGSWENEADITVFVPENGRKFLDETAQVGCAYRYAVIAATEDGKQTSYFSSEKKITCTSPKPALQASVNEDGKPVFSWEAVDGATDYQLYRSTKSGSGYKVIATLNAGEYSYVDTTVTAGKTYYYKLAAVHDGVQSTMSDYKKLTGKCAIPELSVKAGSTGKPVLTWNKISGAKKYEIWRSVDGAAFKKLTTTTKTTYTDTKAAEGAQCNYKVKALGSKSSYNGNFSEVAGCNVTCAAPSLTAKIDAASGKVSLSWKAVKNAVSYGVYRSINDGDFSLAETVSNTSFLDEGIPVDTKCSYYVVALGTESVFNSSPSAVKTLTVTLGKTVVKGSVNNNGKPVLTWTAVTDAVGYNIYRSTSSSKGYTCIGTAEQLTFTDESAAGGKSYYYTVTALGANTEGAQSAYVKLTGKCAAPVIGLEVGKSGKPVLTWQKVAGASKYEIHRSVNGGAFKKLTTTTKLTYTDSKAQAGGIYAYKVKALGSKSSYNSGFSVELSCRATLGIPTVKVTTDKTTGCPLVTWTAVSGADYYVVLRDDEPLITIYGLKYLDRDVVLGKTYSYQVIAMGDQPGMESKPDEEKEIVVLPGQPKITANRGYSQRGYLSWDYVEGATEYAIYRSTKKSSGYTRIGTTTVNRYMDLTGVELKPYYYKMAVVVNGAEGPLSNVVQMDGIRTFEPHNTDPNRFVVVGSNWETNLIWWEITSDGVLTISGIGAMWDGSNFPWKEHTDYFTKVVIADGVTSVRGFNGMKQITDVQFGKFVTRIENGAFSGCDGLTTLTMPASLETIGSNAFSGCDNLFTLVFPEDSCLRTLEERAFSSSHIKVFVAPESLIYIGDFAFSRSTVEKVVLNGKLEYLGIRAFEECLNLKELEINATVRETGALIFYNTKSMETVILRGGVPITLSDLARLKKVVVGGTRTESGVFQRCNALEEVILEESVTKISASAFWLCGNLKQITIPDSVKEIGGHALRQTGITQLTIPASVTKIGLFAFTGSAMEEITFLGDYTSDISGKCTDGITATVYYPGDNPTWTQEVRDSFEGNLTWIAK